ncbi:MADS box transcription factor domain-containing protein [Dioscorea alata]|uniref:MADS box transcription factor domain-containing protein n=1 Tax=Dioscorea alata TaxID=55571 RepID=A0ACB7VP69_DIOAL|nr:MADS box transcription factor domain-containing protein [Dioscorea alata]
MTKGKLYPSFIAKASARKAAFKQRKQGLIKKLRELSILCDVPAFLIIFCHDLAQPQIWSSTPDPHQVLRHFTSMPEKEKSENMLNQADFLELQIKKLEDQFQKIELENSERELTLLLSKALRGEANLDDISLETAEKLSSMVEKKIEQVNERMSTIKREKFLNDSPDEDSNLSSSSGEDTESPSDDHSSG